MTKLKIDHLDQFEIENLQLKAENHRLQSLIYEMRLEQKIEALATQSGHKTSEFNPQTLTWDIEAAS